MLIGRSEHFAEANCLPLYRDFSGCFMFRLRRSHKGGGKSGAAIRWNKTGTPSPPTREFSGSGSTNGAIRPESLWLMARRRVVPQLSRNKIEMMRPS